MTCVEVGTQDTWIDITYSNGIMSLVYFVVVTLSYQFYFGVNSPEILLSQQMTISSPSPNPNP